MGQLKITGHEDSSIIQGNTGQLWNIGVKDTAGNLITLVNDYTCKLVLPNDGIDRPITDKDGDNLNFQAQLTPIETAALSIGNHIAAIEISNSTTTPEALVEEVQIDIIILEARV